MARSTRFDGLTIQFLVADIRAGIAFYSRLLGRPPDFEPYDNFQEWEVLPKCWLQVGEGEARPAYPLRLCVDDVDAERERVERELGVSCSPVERIPGLVAFFSFGDPWGNNLGFYQRLFVDGVPRAPGGRWRDAGFES